MTAFTAPKPIGSDRLTLRLPQASDGEAVIAFLLNKERAEGFGHAESRSEAWRWFALNLGHWHLHGYGYFTVTLKDGTPIGLVGIWNPEGWPEPELGWVMFDGFEGKGFAFEAALRAREWAYDVLGFTTLTSNIVPGNTRSVTLAERLGATYERTYVNVHMGEDMLYRHPAPDALDGDGSVEAYA